MQREAQVKANKANDDARTTSNVQGAAGTPQSSDAGVFRTVSALCALLAVAVFTLTSWQLSRPTVAAYAQLGVAPVAPLTTSFVLHSRMWQLALGVLVVGWVIIGMRLSLRMATIGNLASAVVAMGLLAMWSVAMVVPFHRTSAQAPGNVGTSKAPALDADREMLFHRLVMSFNARDWDSVFSLMGGNAPKTAERPSVVQNLDKIYALCSPYEMFASF